MSAGTQSAARLIASRRRLVLEKRTATHLMNRVLAVKRHFQPAWENGRNPNSRGGFFLGGTAAQIKRFKLPRIDQLSGECLPLPQLGDEVGSWMMVFGGEDAHIRGQCGLNGRSSRAGNRDVRS